MEPENRLGRRVQIRSRAITPPNGRRPSPRPFIWLKTMNGTRPFVGAMKIARNLPVSGRYDEWERFPAPSLRELSSECETEGVSSVGCSMPVVYSPAHINSEIFERLRSSKYTPSASLRSAAPSEREPGGAGTIQCGARKTVGVRAIFIAPTKLKSFYIPPFIGGHSLSHALWACQLPQRGSRGWAVPFNRVLAKPWGWRAIFIAPTKL